MIRKVVEEIYSKTKPFFFFMTKNDPEKAHELFNLGCNILHYSGLAKLFLDNHSNVPYPRIEFSNAAGFNKNADITSDIMHYLGFTRNMIGTVTYEPWKGNPRPRTKRFPGSGSLVNWIGLQNIGIEKLVKRLERERHRIPITVSIAPTPSKEKDEALRDLGKTIYVLNQMKNIDRYEINISCPNVEDNHHNEIAYMLSMTDSEVKDREVYLKISPDINEAGVDKILEISDDHNVSGFTLTNTTIFPDTYFVPGYKKGGVSGDALYGKALQTQRFFEEAVGESEKDYKIIACGGINSIERLEERLTKDVAGIQIYTPIIFHGPEIIRHFREYLNSFI